jgi:murein DD-endopeptidase MepM/ murein hydrolase activator NlpD
MRRALWIPAVAAALLAASGARVPAAAPAPQASAHARAIAVQATAGGGLVGRTDVVESFDGARRAVGPFWWPQAGSLVSVRASRAGVSAVVRAGRATTVASARADGVALLGGLVRAASVEVRVSGRASARSAGVGEHVVVRGLVVAGRRVTAVPGQVLRLPGGTITVGERVDVARGRLARRSFAVGLHLRLRRAAGGFPAGSEVLVAYADAGAAGPPPPAARRTASARRSAAAPSVTSRATTARHVAAAAPSTATAPAPPQPLAPALSLSVPASLSAASAAAGDHFVNGDPERAPPGGFTHDPPIDPARRAALLGPGYVFPVVGGASFSDDFGGPRADTGFHQGIDLFAPAGTPLVAVHDGTLFNVGWNRLGGWRLWLDDGRGNLFYYAHLSAYATESFDGAHVRAGQVIGFVGHTGDAQGTPSHLHFEIHPAAGWAVPPIAYVTAWRAATPGATLAPLQAATPAPVAAPAPPEAITPLDETDISSASALDAGALERAAGASETGVGQAEPDARAAVAQETPPAFTGLP